jgi:threonine aldolase
MTAFDSRLDYLSDTVTLPTAAMREAMSRAEVGDDVYGEDATANRLEALAAERFGKEAACWMPSGTMANLAAILAQCERGRELIVGDDSDLYNYEAGGVSVVGGIVLHPVQSNKRGEIEIDALREAIRDGEDDQCAPAGLIAVETPHVRSGGNPLSLDYLHALRAFCDEQRLPLHIDGARIFNAAVALGVDVREIAGQADTLQFCLSKSLAAPAGSMVVADSAVIRRVRRWRKLLGGGMRQIGILAAAAEVALTTMVDRLAEDHVQARRLAEGLRSIEGIELCCPDVPTNMVFFKVSHPRIDQRRFLEDLSSRGVRMAELGHGRIRAVTHYHHTPQSIDRTVGIVRDLLETA